MKAKEEQKEARDMPSTSQQDILETLSDSDQFKLKYEKNPDDLRNLILSHIQKQQDSIKSLERKEAKLAQATTEISDALNSISSGDFSSKLEITDDEPSDEIKLAKLRINSMTDNLKIFGDEVMKIATEVAHGEFGGQVKVSNGTVGIWKTLSDNLNLMALNLTNQVREIAEVVRAVAGGDLSRKINVHAQGEILELQNIINTMVDQLKTFAFEVTRVSRETGVEGRLGGQAIVKDAKGIWAELTGNVNAMATNLTNQVRNIANVTTAVAKGDLSKKVTADCKGEILDLKLTINQMVDSLQTFALEVTSLATDVGIKGILGGQAVVNGVEGAWKDLTDNVNAMATNLTNQVRSIAHVTTAVAHGDLSQKIDVKAQGEILQLKETINKMVDSLQVFVSEVTRVAKDVGIDGKLGVQAQVSDVDGLWKEIITNVNVMAANLTTQVRAFAQITAAATDGDFTKFITVEASGEMDTLKTKINQMVYNLRDSIKRNTDAREAAELANRAKSEFLGIFSHELRTPFNGILKYTQLTLDTELTQYQREMLSTVHNLANSLLTIIDDILDISKIEANRMTIEQVEFSLRGTVLGALKTLAVKSIGKPVDLIYQADNSFNDYLIGDSFRLRQVILNLVGNAIKFTSKGHVKVTITAVTKSLENQIKESVKSDNYVIGNDSSSNSPVPNELNIDEIIGNINELINDKKDDKKDTKQEKKIEEIDESKEQEKKEGEAEDGKDQEVKKDDEVVVLEFCVSDTGIGIKKEKLGLIFENFTQADGSTTRRFGGTGLGLSISKRLIHLMNGEIWVTSTYGKGSKFYFTIAVKKVDPTSINKKEALLMFNQHQILVISTNHDEAESEELRKYLIDLNLRPTIIYDLDKLSELKEEKFDVIIIDSIEVGEKLRSLPEIKYIPFVLLQKNVSDLIMKDCLDLGIQSCGNTPCSIADLAAYLKPALESRIVPSDDNEQQSFSILLAEDNLVNQKLAVRILEKFGHEVVVAQNGLEAFEKVQQRKYDVILMDVQMPIMGGFEATEKIRQWEKETNPIDPFSIRIPIIALTAHAMLGDREKCMQAQMDEYISKPLKPNLLIQTITKTIHNVNKLKEISSMNQTNRHNDSKDQINKSKRSLSEEVTKLKQHHKLSDTRPPAHKAATVNDIPTVKSLKRPAEDDLEKPNPL